MSYHVFFAFSQGLSQSITVPKGTLAAIRAHVANVEETLAIKRTQYKDNPAHWDTFDPAYCAGFPDVEDEVLCCTVQEHNRWVRWLYERFAVWAKEPPADGEQITPEDASEFWPGLQMLRVRPDRWTREFYRDRMEHYFEVMRGRDSEGVYWPSAKLTPKQAGAVIWLLADMLDSEDIRLEVPKGCDYLASSYEGEYDWCTQCGAVLPEYSADCRKRGCPVQAEWCDEDKPEWFKEAKPKKPSNGLPPQ